MGPSVPRHTLLEAMEGVMSLLNPGPYGVSDDDPKALLLRDLGRMTANLATRPVVIGGIAVIVHGLKRQTVDVDLLVSRADALKLIRALEASAEFAKVRIDRFRHIATRTGLDLCVEGELTSPRHVDRFPSPDAVEKVPGDPLPVVGLIDLLALKVKSARAQDEADFVRLYRELGLGAGDVERVKAKVEDSALRELAGRWHQRALEEIDRDRLLGPPRLE